MTLDRALAVAVRELRLARSAHRLEARMYRAGARYGTAVRAHRRTGEITHALEVLAALAEAVEAGEGSKG